MKFKEVTYKEMMSQLRAHGEDDPITARVILKKGVCSGTYDVNIKTRTFTFSSSEKMFNNKSSNSCYASSMGYMGTWFGIADISCHLFYDNEVALCYLEDKEESK